MLVVNLFGAPGTGKSTTASGLFYHLKNKGVNAELAGEYAKDLVWSDRDSTLKDQIYVFGKQHHRLFRLKDKVDVIIADSPVLLAASYAEGYPECFTQTIKWAFNEFDNLNYLLQRVKPYNPKGRYQTEEESDQKYYAIRDLLDSSFIDYTCLDADWEAVEIILEDVLDKL